MQSEQANKKRKKETFSCVEEHKKNCPLSFSSYLCFSGVQNENHSPINGQKKMVSFVQRMRANTFDQRAIKK